MLKNSAGRGLENKLIWSGLYDSWISGFISFRLFRRILHFLNEPLIGTTTTTTTKKKNTKAKKKKEKNLCPPLRTARAIGSYVPAFALIKTMQKSSKPCNLLPYIYIVKLSGARCYSNFTTHTCTYTHMHTHKRTNANMKYLLHVTTP